MSRASTFSPELSNQDAKGTYAFVSLGCPKNLVDSERMLGLLKLDGYQLVADPDGADFVVVNTCGFIERARDESYSAIREMIDLKRQKKIRGVIVSGSWQNGKKKISSTNYLRSTISSGCLVGKPSLKSPIACSAI